ncbi:hypothetical protein ACFP3Q_08745 [Nocardioides sp. GCM10027113]|uniref:hypothetical protein n=1 Tax=unclassified Nocardioides TaxID=2615069 RepID=UPI00360C5697
MIEDLQELMRALPEVLQWLGVMVAGAVPFVESYFGSVIGIVAGVDPVVAVAAAITGNALSMLVLVLGAGSVRRRVRGERPAPSGRRARLKRAFDRYGVAGVSLLGQSVLPSQITSMAMVSFGASVRAVVLWQSVSIVLWGVAFGTAAALGVDLLSGG